MTSSVVRTARLDLGRGEASLRVDRGSPVDLPGAAWARIAIDLAGICGSDLHLLHPNAQPSPVFKGIFPSTVELGHEMVGRVIEAGPECSIPLSTRVVVDPLLGCRVNERPPCLSCRSGWPSTCESIDDGPVRGYALGFTQGMGGGWGDQLVAHASQLHVVPERLSDELAVLTEPLAVALHALRREPIPAGSGVLVIGAGSVGLLVVAALKALTADSAVTVLARHEHQAERAAALGADEVVVAPADVDPIEHLAHRCEARARGRGAGTVLLGGYSTVIDAAGTAASFSLAGRACSPRGTVRLLGLLQRVEVDLAPYWWRELRVLGSFHYGHGHGAADLDLALDLLAQGAVPPGVILTDVFPLDETRSAVEAARSRNRGVVKVALAPAPVARVETSAHAHLTRTVVPE